MHRTGISLPAKMLALFAGQSFALSAPTPTLGSELLTDGDMELVGTANYTAINNATLSKQVGTPHGGLQVLRVARSTTNNPACWQNALSLNVFHRISVYGRSDGNALPRLSVSGGTATITGTTSTSWQLLDATVLPTAGIAVFMYAITSTGTEYAEHDDATVKALANMLAGVDTKYTRHTVYTGLTISANHQAGVFSDGDDATAPSNYLLAYYDRNTAKVHIAKYLAGSYDSELGAVAATYAAGAVLKIIPAGNDRQIFYNGVKLATYTLSDAALIAGTYAGLFSTDSSNTFSGAFAEV